MSEVKSEYLTVKQTALRHPFVSESSLRYLIFNATTNNFSKVIRRVNRRILICEQDFLAWIDSNGGKANG